MKVNELRRLLKILDKLQKEPDFEEWFESDVDNLKREILEYIDFLGDDEQ